MAGHGYSAATRSTSCTARGHQVGRDLGGEMDKAQLKLELLTVPNTRRRSRAAKQIEPTVKHSSGEVGQCLCGMACE